MGAAGNQAAVGIIHTITSIPTANTTTGVAGDGLRKNYSKKNVFEGRRQNVTSKSVAKLVSIFDDTPILPNGNS